MNFTRRSILAGLGGAASAPLLPGGALGRSSDRLAASIVQADLDLLLHAYQAVHPGLLRYLSPGGFAARVAAAKAWAAGGRSLTEIFVMLARLTAAVRCGHSYPNPNNQRRAARALLLEGRDRVPFAFRWLRGHMIVTGSRDGELPFPVGSEILSIDGMAASALLAAMLPLARADGGNDAKRVSQLSVDPRQRFPAFDVHRPMLTPAVGDGAVRVRVRMPNGRERTLDLPARTEDELESLRSARGDAIGWRFDIDSDGIGRLTMPTWVTYNSRWDWRGFLDTAVDRLIDERARGLVMDIRGNEGGTECGWPLLERLVTADTPLPAFVQRVRYRSLPQALRAPLQTWDSSFYDWGEAAVGPDGDGFYRLQRSKGGETTIRPRGRRFAGPLVVLTDSACSSATFQFANAVRTAGLGTLVGETTGGSRRGLNGSAYFFVQLPGSGLEVDLPIVGSFATRPQPDAGVRPDVAVPVTADDIIAGRDRQMDAALADIRRQRNGRRK